MPSTPAFSSRTGRTASVKKPAAPARRPVGRPPADSDEVVRRILDTAVQQYMQLGFSAVTTDDTARAAGVSKKTLYQHFPSKDALLRAVVRRNSEQRNADICSIVRDSDAGVIERLHRMMAYLAKLFSEMSPALIHDMRRSNPEVWCEIEESRKRCVQEDFGALLREGCERGVFRDDIDPAVFMMVYAATIQHVLNPESFAQLGIPPAKVYESVTKVLFEGLFTEKSRKEKT